MAKFELELVLKDAQAAQSVGDIKKQLKELKNAMLQLDEGSVEFNKLAMAAGQLKEKMNEANETIAAFNPDALEAVGNFAGKAASGISLVTGAMGLFGKQSEETEKTLMKVQSAMAFAQGIQGIKGLGKAFKGLFAIIEANPLGVVIAGIAALGIALAKVYQDYKYANSEVARANELYEKQKQVTSELSGEYDRQIAVLEAQGDSEEKVMQLKREKINLEIAEQKALLETYQAKLRDVEANYSVYESLLDAGRATAEFLGQTETAARIEALLQSNRAERAKEQTDLIKESEEAIKNLENQLVILDIQEQKTAENASKAWKASNDQREKDGLDAVEKRRQEKEKEQEEQDKIDFENWKKDKALEEEHNKHREQLYLEDVARKEAAEKKKYEANKRRIALEKKIDEMQNQFRIDAAKSVLSTVGELFKDNAEAQKAVGAATTLIDTYIAAQKAFTSQLLPGDPTSVGRAYVAAGLAVVAGLARVAAILRVDTSGGSNAATSGGGGNTGQLTVSSQPNVSSGSQPSTLLNEQGQVINQQSQTQSYVSVTEIRAVDTVVEAIEQRSRF